MAAQKQLSLWKLPKVLIFHLKRFHYRQSQSHYSIRRDKINKLVDYQVENLDMSPFVIDPNEACDGVPPNYELCGVVNHMGSMVSLILNAISNLSTLFFRASATTPPMLNIQIRRTSGDWQMTRMCATFDRAASLVIMDIYCFIRFVLFGVLCLH